MQISVAGCSWGVCFAAITFSIVSAFCANGIQPLLSATSKVALHWSGMTVEFRIFAPLTNEKVRLLPFCDAWKQLPSLNRRKWDIRSYICIGHKKVCSWDLGSFAAIRAKYTVQTKFVLKENYSRYFVMTNCCDSWGCLILRSSTDAHLNFLWYCSLSQIIYVLNLKMHSLFLHLIIQGLDRMFGRFWNNMKLWKRAGWYPCVHMCVLPRENLFALPSWESWFCLIPCINHDG